MKAVLRLVTALLACGAASPLNAEDAATERLARAMQSARWTGPLLAANAETLPKGHFYTEPYFYDAISGSEHHPGSSGFYQYGLFGSLTVGLQPSFAIGTTKPGPRMALGDLKLLSQLRLTHFTPQHQVPTIGLVANEVLPMGNYEHLGPVEQGHGSGSFATEVGVNVQYYFLLQNERLLRARINILKSIPLGVGLSGRSVYGTSAGFQGHADPGSKTTLIGAVEYSLTDEWVLALDIEHDHWKRTRISGRDSGGQFVRRTVPSSSDLGFAPAVEYNWSESTGALFGVWIIPKGHNTSASVTPAIAISRFW